MAGLDFRLRAFAARAVSSSGTYRLLCGGIGRARGGFVLAYHNLSPERFIEQIEALAPCKPVSLDELVARHASSRPTGDVFAITFDDGVGETVRAIAAVARARQWPVTFYLPTAYLDEPGGMPFQWLRAIERHGAPIRVPVDGETVDLSNADQAKAFAKRMTRVMYTRPWAEYGPLLRRLMDAVIERGGGDPSLLAAPPAVAWHEVTALARDPLLSFESHGVSHTAVAALSGEDLTRELVTSRDTIAAHTGRPCRHFCYPYGGPASIGATAPAEVARHYRSATTMSRGRLVRRALGLLPRIPLYPHDDADLVRLKALTA
jgi:peptidoglycan/xylan/chitin deacetylase (PgdA/CDA1 family)